MTHLPGNQNDWKSKQYVNNKRKQSRNQPTSGGTFSLISGYAKSAGVTKLVLDEKLKQALLTDHGFSDLQLEQLTGYLKN